MNPFPFSWTASLTNVLTANLDGAAHLSGPRYWWAGALDLEGLALSSTRVAATALRCLTRRRFDLSSERVAASFASLENLRVNGQKPQGFAPMSGFYRTYDGWIRLHANYPHHAKVLEECLGVTQEQEVRAALSSANARDIEARIQAAGGIAAAVRSHAEWQMTPMGKAAAQGPWIEFIEEPNQQVDPTTQWHTPEDRGDAPLRGLRVLDFTRVVAGPSASRLLGALGADVLRVDPPQYPELLDHHIDTGFCKRSIELNLNIQSDRRRVTELMAKSHVVLLGYRPGALDKFGLTPPDITKRWPNIKVVTFNAWGWHGPCIYKRGFDSIVQAASGIADIYRDTDNSPGRLPVQALDHATGMGIVAAVAVMLSTEQYSWARTSLARTAHELINLPVENSVKRQMKMPSRRAIYPTYGTLDYVPPPLFMDGASLEYSHLPAAYGRSSPTWLNDIAGNPIKS